MLSLTVKKVRRGSIVYTDRYKDYDALMFCGYRHLVRQIPLPPPAIPVYGYSNNDASACRLVPAIGLAVARDTYIRKIRSCCLFIGSPPPCVVSNRIWMIRPVFRSASGTLLVRLATPLPAEEEAWRPASSSLSSRIIGTG